MKTKDTVRNGAYAVVVGISMVVFTVFKGGVEELLRQPFVALLTPFEDIWKLHFTELFWSALGMTALVFSVTLLVAAIVGTGLAFWVQYNRWANEWVRPLIAVFKPIPAIAMIALGTILFGSGAAALPWFVAFFGTLWPFTAGVAEGLRGMPETYIKSALSLGKSQKEIVWQVIVPATKPYVFAALRVTAPIALLLTVTAQYFYASIGGLGALLATYHDGVKYPKVVVMVLWMALLSILAETVLHELERRVCKWRKYD